MSHLPRVYSPRASASRGRLAGGLRVLFRVAAPALVLSLGLATGQEEPGAEPPRITAIRFWSLGDVTRIAIEATGEFHFRSDRLHNPERVYFDLIDTQPELGSSVHGTNTIAVGDPFVRKVRVAATQHTVTRVVLDLEQQADFSTSMLANPDRLIIELHAPGEAPANLERVAAAPRETPNETPATEPTTPKAKYTAAFTPPPPVFRPLPVIALPSPPPAYLPPVPVKVSSRRRGAKRETHETVQPSDPYREFQSHLGYEAKLRRLPPPPVVVPVKAAASAAPTKTLIPIAPPADVFVGPPLGSTPPSASNTPTVDEAMIGLPAKRNSTGNDTMIRVLGLKLNRVVLDPGHGGHDAGTSGPNGLSEKDVVLDVAKRLGALIQERLGSDVVYTRSDDTFVPLSRRTALANEKKADLFLSIHANSSPIRTVAGVETYYLNFTSSKQALETAARENAGADLNIHELQDVLKKIALKDKADESREFALRIQASLSALSTKGPHPRDRGVKRAPFVVLIGASMPSVLAEIGFISNSQDESLMKRPDHRQRIAEALYKGVAAYANSLSHFQVAEQANPRTEHDARVVRPDAANE